MADHYSIGERVENETATLLASDPVVWRALTEVLDSGE